MKLFFSHGTASDNKKICTAVAKSAKEILGQDAAIQVDINFVSSGDIARLNKTFRGVEAATDTLSFPFVNLSMGEKVTARHSFQSDPITKRVMLGEIYLNSDKVKAQAEEYGHSYSRELAYLTAHSILHLFGYGHDNPEDENTMNNLCERITEAAGFRR